MKRIIGLVTTTLILGGLATYCGFLISQGRMNVTPDFVGKEVIVFSALIVICAVVWYYSTIGAHHLNKPKLTLSVMGIILIMYGFYAIVDVTGTNTFLSDLTRVVGVYTLIAGLSGFIGNHYDDEEKTGIGSAVHRIKDAEIIEI